MEEDEIPKAVSFSPQLEQDYNQVTLFGRNFLWNQSLFKRLDEQGILFSKDDKEPGEAPKGFERFFKKKKEREEAQKKEDGEDGNKETKSDEGMKISDCLTSF